MSASVSWPVRKPRKNGACFLWHGLTGLGGASHTSFTPRSGRGCHDRAYIIRVKNTDKQARVLQQSGGLTVVYSHQYCAKAKTIHTYDRIVVIELRVQVTLHSALFFTLKNSVNITITVCSTGRLIVTEPLFFKYNTFDCYRVRLPTV